MSFSSWLLLGAVLPGHGRAEGSSKTPKVAGLNETIKLLLHLGASGGL